MSATQSPPLKLRIFCCECGESCDAPFVDNVLSSNALYREHEWLLSVIDPAKCLLAPVCKVCAPKVYPPELLKAARESLLRRPN